MPETKAKDVRLDVHIRWMIRRDMDQVLAIERAAFEFPWAGEDFVAVLRRRNCIGMVAERGDRVLGYMVYELHKKRLDLLNFAVAPDRRRLGVGSQLVDKLVGKLGADRRTRLSLEVRETNLAGQLFFRRMGFVAVAVIPDAYDDSHEDAYQFVYRLRPES